MDSNFWKDRYSDSWDKAAQKERMVIEKIENGTGKKVDLFGLGAGSTEYLSGSAAENNSNKGDADLYIKDSKVFIEVTGPNIKVNSTDSLWIRPDKIQNALNKISKDEGYTCYVVHVIERKDNSQILIRVIPISNELNTFPIITPRIRGTVETYRDIPASYNKILTFEEFLTLIR